MPVMLLYERSQYCRLDTVDKSVSCPVARLPDMSRNVSRVRFVRDDSDGGVS